MSFFRKTLFWVIVLVALAGAFHFFEARQARREQTRQAETKLLPFTARDISGFWIQGAANAARIHVVRSPQGWQIVQPLQARGDAKAIDKLLGHIVGARKDALLFDHAGPDKLAELGFGPLGIRMGLGRGTEETVIVFGTRGPTNNVAYVMFEGRPEVYRVHSDLQGEAIRDVRALRDKTILDFDPVKLRRLEIVRRDGPRVVVEHRQGHWELLEPARGRASMNHVLELLYAIRNGEIKTFNDDDAGSADRYGLSTPLLRLAIVVEADEATHVLTIGDKDRANRAYHARAERARGVFGVEEGMVQTILSLVDKLQETERSK